MDASNTADRTDVDQNHYADRLAHATAQMGDFQELIRFADTKAGAAITFASVLLTILFASFGPMLTLLSQWQEPWQLGLGVITLAATALFFGACIPVFYYAFHTLIPRLRRKGKPKPTVAFFMDVYDMGEATEGDAFAERVSTMPLDELLHDMLRQNFLLSEVLMAKFRAQGLCFRWLRALLILWIAAQIGALLAQGVCSTVVP